MPLTPTALPPTSQASGSLTLDLETYDPHLDSKPSRTGAIWDRGGILGIAYQIDGEAPCYVPLPRVYDDRAAWVELGKTNETLRWLRGIFKHGGWRIIGHNLSYDMLWLMAYGIWDQDIHREAISNGSPATHGRFFDTQYRQALIYNEGRSVGGYSLDNCCKLRKLPQKPIWDIRQEVLQAAETVGVKVKEKDDPRKFLYLLDDENPVLADYAKHDVSVTYELFKQQQADIEAANLQKVDQLESMLLPTTFLAEYRGIRVDMDYASQLSAKWDIEIEETRQRLEEVTGLKKWTMTNALRDYMQQQCEEHGIKYEKTATGKLSAGAKLYDKFPESHEGAQLLKKCAKLSKNNDTFLKGNILQSAKRQKDGTYRVYPRIHQCASDEGGTVTGRKSYSNPSLQNIPKRTDLGAMIRKAYIADEGHVLISSDYSSQEPRWTAHYAAYLGLHGGQEIARAYQEDPDLDLHLYAANKCFGEAKVQENFKPLRTAAKSINLGLAYEMGTDKLLSQLKQTLPDIDREEAQSILESFFAGMPHLKAFSNDAKYEAEEYEFVTTWLGRRAHFDLWEPDYREISRRKGISWKEAKDTHAATPVKKNVAVARYLNGNGWPITRAGTYRAGNRRIQGSAADQTKAAEVVLYYKYGLLTHWQIHDDVTVQVPDNVADIVRTQSQVEEAMVTAIKTLIPMRVDASIGNNWQEQEDFGTWLSAQEVAA